MQEKKENESGSMMMEIIAVLAILAIMTPIVYQQALKRSREVSNINMADEMRMVKDAVSAYLDANKNTISSACITTPESTAVFTCTDKVTVTDIYNFLPDGANICINNTECLENSSEYVMAVFAYNQIYKDENNENIIEPKLYAVLSSTSQPAELKKGRAMQIASLIGAAGGICNANSSEESGKKDIEGSYGAWALDYISGVCQSDPGWTVVARTDM